MFSSYVFTGKLYKAYIHEVKREYRSLSHTDINLSPLTGSITDDWLESEVSKAYDRDSKDPFYKIGLNMHGLDDVSGTHEGTHIVVLDENNQFFAKITIHRNDNQYMLNAMYLYVSGDRRRSFDRSIKKIPSAAIVWYFVSQYAKMIYGPIARILIPSPRDLIFKYLIQYNAVFVKMDDCNIETGIHENNTLAFHSLVVKKSGNFGSSAEDPDYDFYGALFSAYILSQTIESHENKLN